MNANEFGATVDNRPGRSATPIPDSPTLPDLPAVGNRPVMAPRFWRGTFVNEKNEDHVADGNRLATFTRARRANGALGAAETRLSRIDGACRCYENSTVPTNSPTESTRAARRASGSASSSRIDTLGS